MENDESTPLSALADPIFWECLLDDLRFRGKRYQHIRAGKVIRRGIYLSTKAAMSGERFEPGDKLFCDFAQVYEHAKDAITFEGVTAEAKKARGFLIEGWPLPLSGPWEIPRATEAMPFLKNFSNL